jgi:hypothetical protein
VPCYRGDRATTREVAAELEKRSFDMLWIAVVLLMMLWLLGLAVKIGGALIHLLLVIALVIVLYRAIRGRRAV